MSCSRLVPPRRMQGDGKLRVVCSNDEAYLSPWVAADLEFEANSGSAYMFQIKPPGRLDLDGSRRLVEISGTGLPGLDRIWRTGKLSKDKAQFSLLGCSLDVGGISGQVFRFNKLDRNSLVGGPAPWLRLPAHCSHC